MATIILLVLLLAGTSAAFAYTQVLKSERSPLGVPRFERKLAPTCDCPSAEATLRLRLREADRVSAEIVDADGTVVRTLAEDEAEPSGPLAFSWDGRDEEGQVVPDGPYRLRVSLAGADRTILYPTTIRVDATAPRLELVSVRPDELVPGERRRFKIRYRASEEARPILAVGKVNERAEVLARGPYRPAGQVEDRLAGHDRRCAGCAGRLRPHASRPGSLREPFRSGHRPGHRARGLVRVTEELARVGGPLAAAGLALVILARPRSARLAGLGLWAVGAALLVPVLAPVGAPYDPGRG